MTKQYWSLYFIAILVTVFVAAPPAGAFTDILDVTIRDLYKTLNQPLQLEGWSLDGSDPCDLWQGVSCKDSSIIMLSLSGLKLTGYISPRIYNFRRLMKMDISLNNISGEIPLVLPPNATHINMAYNRLIQNIPPSLHVMKNLQHLNLSHNLLSGPIGNVFTGLQNLREVDLSYNDFTGDLPSSFESLTNLTGLYLQDNQLTGSIACLAELPLIDLNIQDNYFSGIIPSRMSLIPHLMMAGNPILSHEDHRKIHPPPAAQPSAMSNPLTELGVLKKKRLGPAGITLMIGGGTLVAVCLTIYIAHRMLLFRVRKLVSLRGRILAMVNLCRDSPISTRDSCDIPLNPAPEKSVPMYTKSSVIRNYICTIPNRFRHFSVEEVLYATREFAPENFLGQGSLGSVYKAEFPDGQISVVRNMKMSGLVETKKFLDLVLPLSRLKHPNIVPLLGYSVEQGQAYLVYKYVRNLRLDDALHSGVCKSLIWGIRLEIAIGVAQAMDYLHLTLPPSVGHGNLKSANILLDEELAPHICDCGLGILRPLTRNCLTLKASEDAIGDTGYIAPEHGLPGFDNTKSDVYAFGVLLLELLTGRKPSDSSKPREEQSLVKWASLRLHDHESLEEMIDPGIRETCSSKALSDFADIISLCIQPVKELRPPMSEVVGFLRQLAQKLKKGKRDGSVVAKPSPSRDLSVQPTPASLAHLR